MKAILLVVILVLPMVGISQDIITIAGNGIAGFSGDGGPATAAELNGLSGIAFSSAGYFFISEAYSKRIRRITKNPETVNNIPNTPQNITIYPNPTHDKITITAPDKIESITITNIIGQVVAAPPLPISTPKEKEVLLNVSGLPDGVYILLK